MPRSLPEWIICPACDGEGSCVNPNIDARGLTREDFDEDPDFAEDYKSGLYNQTCAACSGRGSVRKSHLKTLRQNAEDRRVAAREDGDPEGYSIAGDWRFG